MHHAVIKLGLVGGWVLSVYICLTWRSVMGWLSTAEFFIRKYDRRSCYRNLLINLVTWIYQPIRSVPQLRWLDVDFLPWRPRFNYSTVNVGFVGDRMTLGQALLQMHQ